MSLEEILEVVREEDFNVTLSGGDPLFNPEAAKILIHALKEDGRNVWVYTGYTWQEILESEQLREAISEADVVVDAPFIEKLKDPDLLFRGSSNQHLINVKESLENGGSIVLYSR